MRHAAVRIECDRCGTSAELDEAGQRPPDMGKVTLTMGRYRAVRDMCRDCIGDAREVLKILKAMLKELSGEGNE